MALHFLQLQAQCLHYGVDLQIASHVRSYERQLTIWNEKATGIRPVLSPDEKILNVHQMTSEEKLTALLHFSAIPGFSRHHFGTDIDVYDAAATQTPQLTQAEYKAGGACFLLHQLICRWEKSNNMQGFFRPYISNQFYFAKEPWHLSYSPLAMVWEKKLTYGYFIHFIQQHRHEIALAEEILLRPKHYYLHYVKG